MNELLSTIKKVKRFYKTLAEAEETIERIKGLERREAGVRATISDLNKRQSESTKRLAQIESELQAATAKLGQAKAQVEAERSHANDEIKKLRQSVADSKTQADTEIRGYAAEIENAKRGAREWEDKLTKARAAYEGFKAQF